jgi:hypothetical protein
MISPPLGLVLAGIYFLRTRALANFRANHERARRRLVNRSAGHPGRRLHCGVMSDTVIEEETLSRE